MNEQEPQDDFAGAEPHPAVPELGRAIYLDPQAPSGSPANYEELRGCPSPAGWTALRQAQPLLSADKAAAQLEALRARLVDQPLAAPAGG